MDLIHAIVRNKKLSYDTKSDVIRELRDYYQNFYRDKMFHDSEYYVLKQFFQSKIRQCEQSLKKLDDYHYRNDPYYNERY